MARALAAAAVLAACSPGPSTSDSGHVVDAGVCTSAGGVGCACGGAADCSSGLCDGGVCTCVAFGMGGCQNAAQCCVPPAGGNAACVGGFCCGTAGARCFGNASCCSFTCDLVNSVCLACDGGGC